MRQRGTPLPEPDTAAGEHSRFGALHARTYEMELLLSGAVVFGLLKLPPIIRPALDRFRDGLDSSLLLPALAAQSYILFLLYVLAGTFLLHLVLRAYWIGLLGLESVCQHGVRWDQVKLGPLTMRTARERLGSLARSVDRTDDLCSLLFSFGFLIVFVFIYSLVLISLALLAALAISHLLLDGARTVTIFWWLVGAVVGLQILAGVLDRRLGARLDPVGRPGRLLRALVTLAYLMSPLPWIGIIQLTLGSNLSAARVSAVLLVVCSVLGVTHIGVTLAQRDRLRLDSFRYFPSDLREHGLEPEHYRDRRSASAAAGSMPSIQSAVATGPYLELVVPYLPRLHNQRLQESCPDLIALRREGFELRRNPSAPDTAVAAAASCFGGLFVVRLDGADCSGIHWDFTRERGSARPALVAMLPVAELTPGRHELELLLPRRALTGDDPNTRRHLIPFWR